MSKKQNTVWPASPHTLAKIAILHSYLEKWFSIIGSRFTARDLWYLDGFAGPGEYEGGQDGSPIAAIKAANSALVQSKGRWKAGRIRCVFIEEDAARFANLERCLERCSKERGVLVKAINATFVDGVTALRSDNISRLNQNEPTFAFIDPFGAAGMPFVVVRDLLSSKTAEVLINLDSDGINRIFAAGEHADRDRILTEVFGDSSWRSLERATRSHERMQAILSLYKSKLLEVTGVRYAFSFEMKSASNSINYHLVFASQHSKGLEKMKESMRQLDQDGSYRFCDQHVGQGRLFNFNNPFEQAGVMLGKFSGEWVAYEDVNDYALNESPFVNAKSMLKELEQRGLIEVRANGERRKNTYPDDRLEMQIHFLTGAANG